MVEDVPLNVNFALSKLLLGAVAVLSRIATNIKSYAATVVPECFKDDNASQWKSGKFDPRSLKNP